MSKYLITFGEDIFWDVEESFCATCDTFDEFVFCYHIQEFVQIEMTPETVREGINLLEDGHYWQGSPVTQETLEGLHAVLNEVEW